MWQVLLGIYIVVIILSAVVLWATLVAARRAYQGSKSREPFRLDLTIGIEERLKENHAVKVPTFNELSEK